MNNPIKSNNNQTDWDNLFMDPLWLAKKKRKTQHVEEGWARRKISTARQFTSHHLQLCSSN